MRFLVGSVTLLLLFFSFSNSVRAEVINSFDVQIRASKTGLLRVDEKIGYDFEDQEHHGIFRYIPTVSKVGELYRVIKIKVLTIKRDGAVEHFVKSTTGDQLYLNIGDANKTISGSHQYEISYEVENAIGSNFEDHDEIFWNVTGNGWEIPIKRATAQLISDFNIIPNQAKCFTGPVGSVESQCKISDNNTFTTESLNPFEGLSIVSSYPPGTFPKSILQKEAPGSFAEFTKSPFFPVLVFLVISFLILLNIVCPFLVWRWYQRNRNKKKYGPPAVNFDFPTDKNGVRLTPLEAGIMDSAKIEKDDVLATLYDLAIRKYIKIEQVKTDRKVLGLNVGGKEEFTVKKLKDYTDLQSFEKTLLDRLFKDGNEVGIDTLKKDFYKTFQNMEEDAFSVLVKKGYYTKNPKNQKALLAVGGFFALVGGGLILGPLLWYLAAKVNGRTFQGDETDWKIDGLKLFFAGRSREYNWNAQNLHVVEQMIPYAMGLGYVEQFMKEFQIHYPDYDPYWYSGRVPLYASFSSMNSTMSSNFTTSAPSSSSGMGGGGFSGGGGGGGGGGSW